MRINQNVMAFNASRNLSSTNVSLGKSLEKLSSGFRINRAGDDAAGLVISQGLRAQISGLRQAGRNAQDGISVVQTAEGALNEVHTMLTRMRDLAVQAANTGSNDLAARQANQAEMVALRTEIDRVAESTKFGSVNLLDGTYAGGPVEIMPATQVGFAVPGVSFYFDGENDVWTNMEPAAVLLIDIAGSGEVTVDVGGIGGSTSDVAVLLQQAMNDALQTAGSPYAGSVTVDGVFSPNADPALATGQFTITVSGLADGETFTLHSGFTGALGEWGLSVDSSDPPSDYTQYWAEYQSLRTSQAAVVESGSGESATFQVGANAGDTVDVSIASMRLTGGASGPMAALWDLDLTTDASAAITAIDDAIAFVSEQRGDLGAIQNRFESMINNLSVTVENLSASESRIRDTDMAAEMVSFTRNQVLQQAGTAMLAQANQVPQTILSLLR